MSNVIAAWPRSQSIKQISNLENFVKETFKPKQNSTTQQIMNELPSKYSRTTAKNSTSTTTEITYSNKGNIVTVLVSQPLLDVRG